MENERLIELVRTHPVLYDHSHPKYSDNHYKESTWKEIGREMNHSSISCKARWNNIRDNYRKYKKKMLREHGMLRSYKYGEQLQFLDDFFHDRKSVMKNKGGDDYMESVEVTYSDTIDNVSIYESKDEFQMEDCDVSISSPNSNCAGGATNAAGAGVMPSAIQTITMMPTKYGKMRQPAVTGAAAAAAAIGYLHDESPPPSLPPKNESPQDRAIDAFLAGIAPTLKSLNAYHLNLAKGEIFGIVQKYEMKMILECTKSEDDFMARSTTADNTESVDSGISLDPLK